MAITIIVAIVAVAVALLIAVPITCKVAVNNKVQKDAEVVGTAEDRARSIIDEALKTAETKKREALLEVKEESLLLLSDLQKLINQVVLIDYTIIILGDDKMASNNTELKIDDDYINSQAEQIAKWACDLQGGIDKYTAILNNILAAAIMEGATAEALESFVDYVENLKDIVNDMGEEAKGMCLAFLSEVDEADSYLY